VSEESTPKPVRFPSAAVATQLIDLVLVGDSNSGKSAFLSRLLRNVYEPNVPSGSFRCSAQARGAEAQLMVRDFTIQRSAYVSIEPSVQGALLLFDITNRHSFKAIQNVIRNVPNRDNFFCVLVGTKADLGRSRVVPASEALALATEHSWPYFEVSARSGWRVCETFLALVSNVFEDKSASLSPEFDHDQAPPEASSAAVVEASAVRTLYAWVKVEKVVVPTIEGEESEIRNFTITGECLTGGHPTSISEVGNVLVYPIPETARADGAIEFKVAIQDDDHDRFLGTIRCSFKKFPIKGKLALGGDGAVVLVDAAILPDPPGKRPRTPMKKATGQIVRCGGDALETTMAARAEAQRIYRELVIEGFKERRRRQWNPQKGRDESILETQEVQARVDEEGRDPEQMTISKLKYWIQKMEEDVHAIDREIEQLAPNDVVEEDQTEIVADDQPATVSDDPPATVSEDQPATVSDDQPATVSEDQPLPVSDDPELT
jgi:GTPase SAR1 family protein